MDFRKTLTLARNGDPRAADELFASYYPRVQAMVHRSMARELRGKRPWLAAMFSTGDVVQEVFHSVLRDLDGFEGPNEGAFVSFLSVMIKSRLVDAIRFHEALRRDPRRAHATADVELVDAGADRGPRDPAELAQLQDEVEKVARILSSFPSRERMLLTERFESSMTFGELAEQLGYPSEDSARKAFYAAQAKLVLRLRDDREGEP